MRPNFCEDCVLSQLQLPSSAQLILLHLNLVTDCVLFPAHNVHCGTPSWFAVPKTLGRIIVWHFPAVPCGASCAPILCLCNQTLWADCGCDCGCNCARWHRNCALVGVLCAFPSCMYCDCAHVGGLCAFPSCVGVLCAFPSCMYCDGCPVTAVL